MIISVPSSWNLSQSSLVSRLQAILAISSLGMTGVVGISGSVHREEEEGLLPPAPLPPNSPGASRLVSSPRGWAQEDFSTNCSAGKKNWEWQLILSIRDRRTAAQLKYVPRFDFGKVMLRISRRAVQTIHYINQAWESCGVAWLLLACLLNQISEFQNQFLLPLLETHFGEEKMWGVDSGDDNDHRELKTNIPVVIPPHSPQFVGPGTSSSSLTKRRHFFHGDQSSENISSFLTLRETSLPSWSPLPIRENEKGVWFAMVLGMWFFFFLN